MTARPVDLDSWTWNRKLSSWRSLLPRLQLIAPSRWMAHQASRSALLSGVPCQVLPNAVPEVFQPRDRYYARAALGWPQDKHLILFGAVDSSEPRKGADLMEFALRRLTTAERNQSMSVILGHSPTKQSHDLPIDTIYTGFIDDDESLALAYSASDVVVVPSRMDNLPQSATEAVACGTPVVAFDQGGMSDIISHMKTGWLAKPYDPMELAEGIRWAFDKKSDCPLVSDLVPSWRPQAVARAHIDLYLDVIVKYNKNA